ncbi:MAG: hypothetical protein AB4368_14195 [Xenococcaceae cyanobacterium]
MVDKNSRHSLTIRWQPMDGRPMAKIADWLNSMPCKERREKVAEVCLMTLLPYALEANQEKPEDIERSYWETQERVLQYLFVMKKALGIKSESSGGNVFIEKMFSEQVNNSQTREPEVKTKEKKADQKDMDFIFGLS